MTQSPMSEPAEANLELAPVLQTASGSAFRGAASAPLFFLIFIMIKDVAKAMLQIVIQALAAALAAAVLFPSLMYAASDAGQVLPNTGQQITPLTPRGASMETLNPGLSGNPDYLAGQAVTSVVSPDGTTLLVLTSGYNMLNTSVGDRDPADSTQFVFVYNISNGLPVKQQVIQIANTYNGIVFDPSGKVFYVAGGVNDNVHVYGAGQDGRWAEQAGSPIALGHRSGVGISVKSQAAGLAITQDGAKLVVANYYNDSISVLTKLQTGWVVTSELDLRPGKINPKKLSGVPGGEYPFWVTIKGNDTAFVSSIRDREVVVVSIPDSPKIVARIRVPGQPNKMVLNASQSTLYVAQDNSDSVGIIDTTANQLLANIDVTAPQGLLPGSESKFKGNDTNSVTLSRDEALLYVTNGWMNDVAVVQLSNPPTQSKVIGIIPTGWYPNSVSLSRNGKFMYVLNGKSPTGPNPGHRRGLTTALAARSKSTNQYVLQLVKAGLQSLPTPNLDELGQLTNQVASNNHFSSSMSAGDTAKMAFLRSQIKHVIYIIKENRTYDQVLGDLEVGNGDPGLTEFPENNTPNFHRLARNFVTLDNFYDTSEVSYDGWAWSTSAHAMDVVEKQVTVNYGDRGLSYDSEGENRNVNVGYSTLAERIKANPMTPNDPDLLPGNAAVAAPDGPDGEEGKGFLWNAALRAGLTVRNYGFFLDLARYRRSGTPNAQDAIPLLTDPAAAKTVVAYPTDADLQPHTDPYFRGFDQSFPDYYRFKEWEREFDTLGLPNLTLLRLTHDHFGNFSTAIAGLNTPELQIADNDYALGLVAQKIATSRYKDDTLIFVIEDDAQDGGDHVDAHRSTAFVIGPYVKHNVVVSTAYTTLGMIRTMEDILGIGHMNLNDASAIPMADVFDVHQKEWSYQAVPSDLLPVDPVGVHGLPIPQTSGVLRRPTHDAAYWTAATQGMDFSQEDRVDGVKFNRVLWQGLMESKPYPSSPSGLDLRANRKQLLQQYQSQQLTAPR